MAFMTEQMKKKIHIRNTDFFLKNYRTASDDIDRTRIKDIVDIELECLGYGVFNPRSLLDNFIGYTLEMLKMFRSQTQIHSLKIVVNGFTLDPSDPVLQKLARQIPGIKQNIKTLWIHTSNLKDVTLKDFNQLLRLSHHMSDINFQDFSLQCANWTFTPNQPTFQELDNIFKALILDSVDLTGIKNKRFRLEMSGWYYRVQDAKAFLGFGLEEEELKKVPEKQRSEYAKGNKFVEQDFAKQLQKFFVSMQTLLKQLLNVMQNIESLELDMRNSHDLLRLKNLKKRLDNITKDNRSEKSIMSKRVDIQADSMEKELNLMIVM